MSVTKLTKKDALQILSKGNWFPVTGAVLLSLVAVVCASFLISLIVSAITPLFSELSENIVSSFPKGALEGMTSKELSEFQNALSILFVLLVYLILSVLSYVFMMPLFMGSVKYVRTVAFCGQTPFFEVFCYFSSGYFKALRVGVSVTYSCLWRIFLCFIPLDIVKDILVSEGFFDNTLDFSTALCYLILCIVAYLCTLMSAKFCAKFFIPLFEFLENGSTAGKDNLLRYSMIDHNRKKLLFSLFFSLSGWVMLCFLVIPAVFIVPYILMCYFVLQKNFFTYTHTDNQI